MPKHSFNVDEYDCTKKSSRVPFYHHGYKDPQTLKHGFRPMPYICISETHLVWINAVVYVMYVTVY